MWEKNRILAEFLLLSLSFLQNASYEKRMPLFETPLWIFCHIRNLIVPKISVNVVLSNI